MYHRTIRDTPAQDVYVIYIIFNLLSVIYCQVITYIKQRRVDIDNLREKSNRFTHYCAIGDIVYVDKAGISCKLDSKKQGTYIIIELFKIITV